MQKLCYYGYSTEDTARILLLYLSFSSLFLRKKRNECWTLFSTFVSFFIAMTRNWTNVLARRTNPESKPTACHPTTFPFVLSLFWYSSSFCLYFILFIRRFVSWRGCVCVCVSQSYIYRTDTIMCVRRSFSLSVLCFQFWVQFSASSDQRIYTVRFSVEFLCSLSV